MIFLLNLEENAKERWVREGGRGGLSTKQLKETPKERWVREGGRFWRGRLYQ